MQAGYDRDQVGGRLVEAVVLAGFTFGVRQTNGAVNDAVPNLVRDDVEIGGVQREHTAFAQAGTKLDKAKPDFTVVVLGQNDQFHFFEQRHVECHSKGSSK